MKGLLNLAMAGFLVLATTTSMAATKTNMDAKNWVCTTNASSAANDAEKKADENMAKHTTSAKAFSAASKNCRDCTEIKCSVQD